MEQLEKYFQPTPKLEYIDVDLPINIDPENFTKWLNDTINEDLTGDYGVDVVQMCRYGCYYIYLLAKQMNLDINRLRLCSGFYGMAEHYWMLLDNKYILDLTLKQFVPNAPKLAIVDKNQCGKYKLTEAYYVHYTLF